MVASTALSCCYAGLFARAVWNRVARVQSRRERGRTLGLATRYHAWRCNWRGRGGTLGGAMVMNAGTHLGDMSLVLMQARVLGSDGQVQELPASALGLRYRGSAYPPGAVLLGATLRLQQGERAQIEALMHASYARRQRTQPLSQPNAGSIFKNPPGMAAGRLIEALGLKGTRLGGATISPLHANFIVNVGHATAADVEALMAHVQTRVQAAYNVDLEPEVHIVGEEG